MTVERRLTDCILWLARNDDEFNGETDKSDLASYPPVVMLCEVFGDASAMTDGRASLVQSEALAGAIITMYSEVRSYPNGDTP